MRTLLLLFSLMWTICSGTLMHAKTQQASIWRRIKKGCYEENLEIHRTPLVKKKETKTRHLSRISDRMALDQTESLDLLLSRRKMAYERLNALKGYTIQVYMGNSRKAALRAQAQAALTQSTYAPKLHYRQPNYTVHLGFFTNKLEAYTTYLGLVQKMPSAMVRPYVMVRTTYCKEVLGENP